MVRLMVAYLGIRGIGADSFQFLYGTINGNEKMSIAVGLGNFNSYMVRLMVKTQAETGKLNAEFQFLYGTINGIAKGHVRTSV